MDSKQDLIDEKEALDARIGHIDEIMNDAEYVNLPGEDTERIKLQRELMLKYSEVLGERIREFDAERQQKDRDKDVSE
jgi:hypothetical protein